MTLRDKTKRKFGLNTGTNDSWWMLMHILWFSFIYGESSLQTEGGLPKLTHDPSKIINVEAPKAHQPGKKKGL